MLSINRISNKTLAKNFGPSEWVYSRVSLKARSAAFRTTSSKGMDNGNNVLSSASSSHVPLYRTLRRPLAQSGGGSRRRLPTQRWCRAIWADNIGTISLPYGPQCCRSLECRKGLHSAVALHYGRGKVLSGWSFYDRISPAHRLS